MTTATLPEQPVSRSNLVRALRTSRGPLAVVAAPAGYGKTALLSEWREVDERPFAWAVLDGVGDSSRRLVRAVAEALDAAVPVADGAGGPATGVAALGHSFAAREPFVLVLDDLHLLGGGALEAVRTLVGRVPAGSQLAVASRTASPLPVGRLRADRAVTEVGPADLVMTAGETAELLERAGLDVPTRLADELARRAEGWAAGLSLAAVALGDQPDLPAAVARFGGDDAIVADYLRDEVLGGLAPEARTFLLRASVLDRLSGPLCDAVLARERSGALLSALGRDHLLLVPLDRTDEAYRCPRLLAEMLRADLARTDPAEKAALHRRAGDWYAVQGDVERALHHTMAAGDTARAAALLGGIAPGSVTRGGSDALRRRLAGFTAEDIALHPSLALAAANDHLLAGELDPVRGWASALRRTRDDTAAPEHSGALDAGVAILDAAAAADGPTAMGRDAARAYALEPEDSPWRALCCLLEGAALHLTGDRDAAETRLMEGVRRGAVAAPNVQTLCLAQLALGAAERHDWESAAGFCARAVAQVEHYALGDWPMSALVLAVSAAVRARRGRVDEAQEDVSAARRLLGELTDYMPWYEAETHMALAFAALRLSDAAGAREHLAGASRLARLMPDARVLGEWIADSEERLGVAGGAPTLLTTAELRILTYLPTHLSFREIGGRLHVSANTVKTQAHAVYRKLDAGSRSHAVTRATQLGLLDL